MEAIRQIVTVKNHQINITLPSDFIADEVEVIIFPTDKKGITIPEWQINEVRERTSEYLKNPSTAQDFFEAMKEIEDEL
jgi:ketopantoate reductase|nr:hypothetical protein [uncultured Flavobacterium sp.]